MTRTLLKTGTFAIILSALAAQTALAFPASMTITGATNQPIGHYEFCKQYSAECDSISDDNGPLRLDESNWKTILEVNYTVNTAIQPMTDQEIYGVEERWAYPRSVGDCEDYVLLKRKVLAKQGIPLSNLLITVVRKPDGEGHAVLTVRSSEGDFILDNLENEVKLWSETPYRYLKRQASFHAGRWVSIENGDTMMVSAVGK